MKKVVATIENKVTGVKITQVLLADGKTIMVNVESPYDGNNLYQRPTPENQVNNLLNG